MRIRITHVAPPVAGSSQRFADAIGIAEGEGGEDRRCFLPGWLPCGECGRCRRGLVGACANGRPLFPDPPGLPTTAVTLEVAERFITPIDVPAEAGRLDDELAACAGLVATLLDATATAGLTPGDIAIWLGAGVVAEAGAALSSARGCNAYWLPGLAADLGANPPAVDPPAGVTLLSGGDTTAGRLDVLASGDSAGPPGRRARRLFVASGEADMLGEACALADPGSTIALLGAGGARLAAGLELPERCRLLALGGYHPDFVVEALAALRRGDVPPARLGSAAAHRVVKLG